MSFGDVTCSLSLFSRFFSKLFLVGLCVKRKRRKWRADRQLSLLPHSIPRLVGVFLSPRCLVPISLSPTSLSSGKDICPSPPLGKLEFFWLFSPTNIRTKNDFRRQEDDENSSTLSCFSFFKIWSDNDEGVSFHFFLSCYCFSLSFFVFQVSSRLQHPVRFTIRRKNWGHWALPSRPRFPLTFPLARLSLPIGEKTQQKERKRERELRYRIPSYIIGSVTGRERKRDE